MRENSLRCICNSKRLPDINPRTIVNKGKRRKGRIEERMHWDGKSEADERGGQRREVKFTCFQC